MSKKKINIIDSSVVPIPIENIDTDQIIPARFLKATSKLNFGENRIVIDGTNGANQVSGEDIDANCTVDVSLDDFTSMLNGDLNPMGAFMSGKMKVKGDTGVALKLQTLFS